MANLQTDGNISWEGGMDTSMSPDDLPKNKYSKAGNMIIPDSLAGLETRKGMRCCNLKFRTKKEEQLYRYGSVEGIGHFVSGNQFYLTHVVNGVVFRFQEVAYGTYYCVGININFPNYQRYSQHWNNKIPNGCIINNGFDLPILVTSNTARRLDPDKKEMGIGKMGVYVQHRYFQVDQSGRIIVASDFNQPTKIEEQSIVGNIGFAAPDDSETITAIGKQKTLMNYIEGGNLVFSTNEDIYSCDVRGDRASWNSLGTNLGKVSETIPGFSAISSYSFEPFNSNIYFRSVEYGLADLKQSEYQFAQLDTLSYQSTEASLYFNNDTDWMLDRCYTKSYGKRLLTTIAPELSNDGGIYWNGILSYHPSAIIEGRQAQHRYESVWTGVRPWGMTVVKAPSRRPILFIHSYDSDGSNRLYMMDDSIDYDIDQFGDKIEIRSFVETRGYIFENPLLHKKCTKRVLKSNPVERTISFTAYARPEIYGQWSEFYDVTHNICRVDPTSNSFNPTPTHPIGKRFNMSDERFSECYAGIEFTFVQYRFEFVGPMRVSWLALEASAANPDTTTTSTNETCDIAVYNYRPDYYYLISNANAS